MAGDVTIGQLNGVEKTLTVYGNFNVIGNVSNTTTIIQTQETTITDNCLTLGDVSNGGNATGVASAEPTDLCIVMGGNRPDSDGNVAEDGSVANSSVYGAVFKYSNEGNGHFELGKKANSAANSRTDLVVHGAGKFNDSMIIMDARHDTDSTWGDVDAGNACDHDTVSGTVRQAVALRFDSGIVSGGTDTAPIFSITDANNEDNIYAQFFGDANWN